MKAILKAPILLLLIFWTISASAQVTVNHSFVNNSAFEVFFLKDFDISRPSSGPPIFFLDITNAYPDARTVVLTLEVAGERSGNLSRGETIPFELNPGLLRISNQDLFSNAGPYRLDRYQVAEEVIDDLLQDVLATGKLPSDVYTFLVQVIPQDASPSAQHAFDIRVSNPKRVDIIGPGSPVTGRARDCEPIFSNTPPIRWDSRMKVFRFVLAEYAPGEDPENALNKEPRFTRIFTVGNNANSNLTPRDLGFNDRMERLPSNSFQYPASGTRLPLKPGKTYVYQVTGLVNSSSGFFSVPSEVYCFKIPRLDQLGAGRQQFELILRNFLESDYEKLFGENGELAEYQPTGMTMNGKKVTLTEILTRMQKLKSRYSGYSVE